jgi:hypothetical protein
MRVVREEERVKRVLPVAPAIDEEREEAFAQFGVLGLDRCHFDILVNQSLENKYENAKTFYFIILKNKIRITHKRLSLVKNSGQFIS